MEIKCDEAIGCKICGKCMYRIFVEHIQEHLEKEKQERLTRATMGER